MNKDLKFSYPFIILLLLNVTFLIASNIIGSKIIILGSFVVTAADLLFPTTYILNDIFAEVYDYKKTKFVIYASFICNIIMVIIFYLAAILPYPAYYTSQSAFEEILMYAPRILLASVTAYFIGSILNAKIMSKLKERTNQKLYVRTITSTIVGELFDTIIFVTISFIGEITTKELLTLYINTYLLKIFIEISLTPLTYFIINKVKKIEYQTI